MKPDKELIELWKATENKNNFEAITEYNKLSSEEYTRLFDLIVLGIEMKGGKEKNGTNTASYK